MRPGQIDPRRRPARRRPPRLIAFISFALGWPLAGPAQVPAPRPDASRLPDLVARRAAILAAERVRLAANPGTAPAESPAADGSTRFDPLAEVVPPPATRVDPATPPPASAARAEAAGRLFDLAMAAARGPALPLGFVDECLREALKRQPDHAEARRLLGFVPHEGAGWATPFAAQELAAGKVDDPTFGWVPADWVPHLRRGELPAPGGKPGRWLPAAEADSSRRDFRTPWKITTEHFEIHANTALADVIGFGRRLETLHQLFFALMADLVGPDQHPLALRLRNPKARPTVSTRPKLRVDYFAARDDYAQHLAPVIGPSARESLGIYLPKKEFKAYGGISYFFDDAHGQLDATATLYHEVSHQLLFESAGATQYARNPGNYWVFEGLGTYFETLQTGPDGSLRVGGLVGPRIASARHRLVDAGELIPLGPFVAMGPRAFKAEAGGDIYLHYAEAMALAVFLMQADDGRHREAFLDYARDAYKGQLRDADDSALAQALGRPYPDLQREFLAYLRRAEPAR